MQPQLSKEIRWLLEEKYHGQLTPLAKRDIARLQKGEHIDYVIGFVDFLGCRIDVSHTLFIPRPETEYWVKQAIGDMQRDARKNIRCLDLFAGSGCIGVAILKHLPQAHVDFGDKQRRLLSQIRLNAKKNGIEKKRYGAICSDVFSDIAGRYDYILANSPYIPERRKNMVQNSVLQEEPHLALFGGKDGLRYIRKFIAGAIEHLNSGGTIYLEFDSSQRHALEKLIRKHQFREYQFFKDQYKRWRWVKIVYNEKNGSRKRTSRARAR